MTKGDCPARGKRVEPPRTKEKLTLKKLTAQYSVYCLEVVENGTHSILTKSRSCSFPTPASFVNIKARHNNKSHDNFQPQYHC